MVKINDDINAFLELNKNSKGGTGLLKGKTLGIKANICVKGMNCNCASKVLENFRAPYDAEVVEKIKKEGGEIIGLCNMDEFACGGSGETSAFGPVKNPVDNSLITGGSSSGSAAAVAEGYCDVALGSDTGGSIRNPASHCGVVGLKPTYGSVSRYGLIDLSMSLDQIGPIAKNVEDCALLFSVISGKDNKDSISVNTKKIDLKKIKEIPKNIKVGILDLSELNVDSKIKELVDIKINSAAKKYNWKVKSIKIPHLDLAVETYYPLVYVEFFSGTRKFDGRRYGKKIEDSAGPEVLRRILGGSEITKAEYGGRYYSKALQVKKFIEREFEKVFKDVDCVVSPTVPRLPWKIGEKISVEEGYAADILTIPSNLAGNCAISIPSGKINNIPVGMQIICDKFQEEKLLRIANAVEN
jgi:aspartyl-tRNA(Asn)/glutamyl-tRNA(Gln) amidotransferase subunit A